MNIALVADVHFGMKKNSPIFYQSTMNFFMNQFIPDLRSKRIHDIIILGDLFDVRESVNIKTLMGVYELLNVHMSDFNIHILIGNHDIYHTNSNDVNVVSVMKHIPNVTVYTERDVININGLKLLIQPWLIDGDEFEAFVDQAYRDGVRFDAICGHFDIIGIRYNEFGIISTGATKESVDPKVFSKVTDRVYTGHFHTRTIETYKSLEGKCQIMYCGSAAQHNFGDYGTERGYTLIDENFDETFIENTESAKFIKLEYPTEFNQSDIENNIIQLKIESGSDSDSKAYDKYVELMHKFNPADKIAFVYDKSEVIESDVDIDGDYHSGTIDELIIEFISSIDEFDGRDEVMALLLELYLECMAS